jgi:hypothetical protein
MSDQRKFYLLALSMGLAWAEGAFYVALAIVIHGAL